MDRTRASSLESHHNPCHNKYDSFSMNARNIGRRNRIHSLVGNHPEFSDESCSMDYYYKHHRPLATNANFKSQFDSLQCTVNRMLNDGAFDEMEGTIPSVNLSETLKHEYRQMMSALKELESILGCKQKNSDVNFQTTNCNSDNDMHQLQREIYFRDSLIKCLSDQLKVLCKANDKLIIDYENQESILSEELILLKRQLEKATDSLSALKSRSNMAMVQDIESESFYLRESLRTKELMIADLKHRLDNAMCENSDLKRELAHSNRKNEQLQTEIESLKSKLDCKHQIIEELQMKLNCDVLNRQDHSLVNHLRDELCLAHEENEMTKEAILEQSDLLEDFRNQIKILTENNQFKDDTISELRCCLRKLTECTSSNIPMRDTTRPRTTDERASQSTENNLTNLFHTTKRYINLNLPDLNRMIDNQLDPYHGLEKIVMDLVKMVVNQPTNNSQDVELFKEFLTKEINLKNGIMKYLVSNLNETGRDGLDRLQNQMDVILSSDMDQGFRTDLKNYLHQCFLLDDNLRTLIEYLVTNINSIQKKIRFLSSENMTLMEKYAIYQPNSLRDKMSIDTNSRLTNDATTNTRNSANELTNKIKIIEQLEEELKLINGLYQQDKRKFNAEIDSKTKQLNGLTQEIANLQSQLKETFSLDEECRKLNADYQKLLVKSKECQMENDRLNGELEMSTMKNQQLERSLNMKNEELDNLEVSMKRVSNQFADLSLTQESAQKSMETMKDTEIKRLNEEIASLKNALDGSFDLKQSNNDLTRKILSLSKNIDAMEAENGELTKKISALSKNIESLDTENFEMKRKLSNVQKELDQYNIERMELLQSLAQLQDEKNREINREPQLKSSQTDRNDELLESMEKLKLENMQMNQLRSSLNNLKIENKSLDVRYQTLVSDRDALEDQLKQLRSKMSEINRNCEENHVGKDVLKSETDVMESCKQKITDFEGVLACLTEELNEKVKLVEELRKAVRNDSSQNIDICDNLNDLVEVNKQLVLQKESEIVFLKSKLEAMEALKSPENLPAIRVFATPDTTSQIANLLATITDLEDTIDHLNKKLIDRSENITRLQKMLNEKDEIIENTNKMIKAKSESIGESEKMVHLLSLENTNIREELSTKFQDESQIKLLKTTIDNLTQEIAKLRLDNEKCRAEVSKLSAEKEKKSEHSIRKVATSIPLQTTLPDSSVQQINNEIQKLYIDFEGKSNEIKEYSLKEIKNRDRKIDELNLELKLKSDQFTTIMVENRRLQDQIEMDSQKSTQYEQNLLLKEQLLAKLLKEKEKVRATFITELHNKNEELNEKTNTVYFLNAELHRLASEVEILNSELHVVKVSDKFAVQSKTALEISQTNFDSLHMENQSLKLCINLNTAELELVKNELTVKQITNKNLTDEIDHIKRQSVKNESDLQRMVDSLTGQLKEIQNDFRAVSDRKSELELAIRDLQQENVTLKFLRDKLETEKSGFQSEMEQLSKDKTLKQALEQIGELTAANSQYKTEAGKMSKKIQELEIEYKLLMDKLEKTSEQLINKEKESKERESYFDVSMKQKLYDCDKLRTEYEELVKQYEELQQRFGEYENQEQQAYRMVDQKNSQINFIQDNLEHLKNQLLIAENKLKACNSQWLDKYGQLKSNFHQMECDYQHQIESINLDRDALETTMKNQSCKLSALNDNCRKLSEDNSRLMHENCLKNNELDRTCFEKNSLQNCNLQLTSQIESITKELLDAHREICELQVQLHGSQSKINEFSMKLKENLSTIRHYGSHPLLNQADLCTPDAINFEQKDYCDLRTRYSALCSQIDNMICQLKKKDKRIIDLQKEQDQMCHKLINCDRIQCDYQDLNYKYQQLKDDFNNLSKYYQNMSFPHNQRNMELEGQEVSVIQVCAEQLQDTINCQNQQIDELRASHQSLMGDYHMCCERLKQLEEQIQFDNMEMEKWQQDFCSSENKYKQLETKYDKLKNAYDNAMGQNEHIQELQQELTDKTARLMGLTNINDNIEQQLNCQNQLIDDLKSKHHSMELFYEQELEICRRTSAKPFVANEIHEKISCLKERNKTLECDLMDLQNQLRAQCLSYDQLKQKHECEMIKFEEMRQEFNDHCAKMDKLSAQLFDKNDMLEQITAENHEIHSALEDNVQKISQLKQQTDDLNLVLSEKSSELIQKQKSLEMAEKATAMIKRESVELSNQAEYLSGQLDQRKSMVDKYKQDLANCCRTLDEMKLERSHLCDELNAINQLLGEKDQMIFDKNELLTQYCKELELNYELIQKMQMDRNQKSSLFSVKEFCEMKVQNEKLTDKVEYLQQKLESNGKSPGIKRDTLANADDNHIEALSRMTTPISDYGPDRWLKQPSEKYAVSPFTYSSSRSVAWQKTQTDQSENPNSQVYELQKAIDEYNTLVTSIELSEVGLNPSVAPGQPSNRFTKSITGTTGKLSIVETARIEPKIDVDVPNTDEVDVYIVDVEAMSSRAHSVDPNVRIDAPSESLDKILMQAPQMHTAQGVSSNQPEFRDVIDLLKNCNVSIDYDETKEPFEAYFSRMMQKYNELEQFYLASMKINLDDPQDPSDYKSLETFTELFEKSQQKLIQYCQLLKSSITLDSTSAIEDSPSTNDQRITTEDLKKLVDVVSHQQLQLTAIRLAHDNLQQLVPIRDSKLRRVSPTHLNQEYESIWLDQDICDPNIRILATKVRQMSLDSKMVTLQKSQESAVPLKSVKSPVENVTMRSAHSLDSEKANLTSQSAKLRSGSIQNTITAQENAQSKQSRLSLASVNRVTEPANKRLSSKPVMSKTPSVVIKSDTKSINFGRQLDLNQLPESIMTQLPQEKETRIHPSTVMSSERVKSSGPNFQQQFYEGISLAEGKTQAMKNMEDNIQFASIGQFEKEMHQLKNIDFENFDSSIDMRDRVRIYSAEIDYLNEKNLFNIYAINAITNGAQYLHNSKFVDQLCDSLTSKAQFIEKLQTQFKFDPHISKKEKELISKVLDPKNDLTFRKVFDSYINDVQITDGKKSYSGADLVNKINELSKKLEHCQSQLNNKNKDNKDQIIEKLVSEKQILTDRLKESKQALPKTKGTSTKVNDSTTSQLQECRSTIDKLLKENQCLKEIIQTSSEKINNTSQLQSNDQTNKSKIPLLRGSTIEALPSDRKSVKWDDVNKRVFNDMINIAKNISHTAETLTPFRHSNHSTDDLVRASKDIMKATEKMTQAIADIQQPGMAGIGYNDEKSLLQSSGKLVSPDDVKAAIVGETSIESLRQFAMLLAEDNFDLAAEIEKLLLTIEELRRQLKENCDILSETVDMLQNSENFVNQLEKKLNVETKKTQVITTRIDKMNELNEKVIFELERILKQPVSLSSVDVSSQKRYDYLFECLKKIECENTNLLTKRDELERLLLEKY